MKPPFELPHGDVHLRLEKWADNIERFGPDITQWGSPKFVAEEMRRISAEHERLDEEVAGLREAVQGWLKANGHGGWIYGLRVDVVRLRAALERAQKYIHGCVCIYNRSDSSFRHDPECIAATEALVTEKPDEEGAG